MISIKEFLGVQERDSSKLRVITTLLEGISRHSPAGDPADHERFQADLRESILVLTPETQAAELLLMAGRTVKALEEHNRRTAFRANQQSSEFRMIVEMLTRTIAAITSASSRSSAHLAGMQQDLQTASSIDDVRILKSKLSDCLKGIETEVRTQHDEVGATLESLRQQLLSSQKALAGISDPRADQLTGLSGRPQAEQALTECCRSPVQTFALLCVVDRIKLINDRYGTAIGDRALRQFGEYVMRDARPEDSCFRWSGPSFLILMPRTESMESMRLTVARSFAQKCEVIIDTETRNSILPLSSHWAIFPMLAAPRLLFGKLDLFVSSPDQTR